MKKLGATNRGFSLLEMPIALAVVGMLTLSIGSFLATQLKASRSTHSRLEFDGIVQTIQTLLRNEFGCASTLKNGQTPVPGRAKFNPDNSLPLSEQLSAIALTPTLSLSKNSIYPPTNLFISNISLSEKDASFRVPTEKRYFATLAIEAQMAKGGFFGTGKQSYKFPLWVITNNSDAIIACGLDVKRMTSSSIPIDNVVTPVQKILSRNTAFSSAGTFTWTIPVGVTEIEVEAWSGGAGGSGSRWFSGETCGGGGGGAGGYMKATLSVTPGSQHTVIIGAGGLGGHAGSGPLNGVLDSDSLPNAGNSTAGGTTRFGNFMTVGGGLLATRCGYGTCSDGSPCHHTGNGGAGGCATVGSCTCNGCLTSFTLVGGNGANGYYNYENQDEAIGGRGGNAPLGGSGAPHNYETTMTANAGVSPGGAGGGGSMYNDTTRARPGSNGAMGRVIVWY